MPETGQIAPEETGSLALFSRRVVLADREDGSGCAFILDRPSGVLAADSSTGIGSRSG